jgi:hypothetical protein
MSSGQPERKRTSQWQPGGVAAQFDEPRFADVCLHVVDGGETRPRLATFCVHRMVLVAESEYFQVLFDGPFAEAQRLNAEPALPDEPAAAFAADKADKSDNADRAAKAAKAVKAAVRGDDDWLSAAFGAHRAFPRNCAQNSTEIALPPFPDDMRSVGLFRLPVALDLVVLEFFLRLIYHAAFTPGQNAPNKRGGALAAQLPALWDAHVVNHRVVAKLMFRQRNPDAGTAAPPPASLDDDEPPHAAIDLNPAPHPAPNSATSKAAVDRPDRGPGAFRGGGSDRGASAGVGGGSVGGVGGGGGGGGGGGLSGWGGALPAETQHQMKLRLLDMCNFFQCGALFEAVFQHLVRSVCHLQDFVSLFSLAARLNRAKPRLGDVDADGGRSILDNLRAEFLPPPAVLQSAPMFRNAAQLRHDVADQFCLCRLRLVTSTPDTASAHPPHRLKPGVPPNPEAPGSVPGPVLVPDDALVPTPANLTPTSTPKSELAVERTSADPANATSAYVTPEPTTERAIAVPSGAQPSADTAAFSSPADTAAFSSRPSALRHLHAARPPPPPGTTTSTWMPMPSSFRPPPPPGTTTRTWTPMPTTTAPPWPPPLLSPELSLSAVAARVEGGFRRAESAARPGVGVQDRGAGGSAIEVGFSRGVGAKKRGAGQERDLDTICGDPKRARVDEHTGMDATDAEPQDGAGTGGGGIASLTVLGVQAVPGSVNGVESVWLRTDMAFVRWLISEVADVALTPIDFMEKRITRPDWGKVCLSQSLWVMDHVGAMLLDDQLPAVSRINLLIETLPLHMSVGIALSDEWFLAHPLASAFDHPLHVPFSVVARVANLFGMNLSVHRSNPFPHSVQTHLRASFECAPCAKTNPAAPAAANAAGGASREPSDLSAGRSGLTAAKTAASGPARDELVLQKSRLRLALLNAAPCLSLVPPELRVQVSAQLLPCSFQAQSWAAESRRSSGTLYHTRRVVAVFRNVPTRPSEPFASHCSFLVGGHLVRVSLRSLRARTAAPPRPRATPPLTSAAALIAITGSSSSRGGGGGGAGGLSGRAEENEDEADPAERLRRKMFLHVMGRAKRDPPSRAVNWTESDDDDDDDTDAGSGSGDEEEEEDLPSRDAKRGGGWQARSPPRRFCSSSATCSCSVCSAPSASVSTRLGLQKSAHDAWRDLDRVDRIYRAPGGDTRAAATLAPVVQSGWPSSAPPPIPFPALAATLSRSNARTAAAFATQDAPINHAPGGAKSESAYALSKAAAGIHLPPADGPAAAAAAVGSSSSTAPVAAAAAGAAVAGGGFRECELQVRVLNASTLGASSVRGVLAQWLGSGASESDRRRLLQRLCGAPYAYHTEFFYDVDDRVLPEPWIKWLSNRNPGAQEQGCRTTSQIESALQVRVGCCLDIWMF